jgi:ribosome production factor 1
LKLRWLKKNIPAVQNFGEDAKPLTFDTEDDPFEEQSQGHAVETKDQDDGSGAVPATSSTALAKTINIVPPKHDEYLWQWKVCVTLYIHPCRLNRIFPSRN